MKIKLTDFALRHFDKKFNGTKILDITPKEFEDRLNVEMEIYEKIKTGIGSKTPLKTNMVSITDGYAPFCKLVTLKNFTTARTGTLPIKIENYQFLRSGYGSRTPGELPVLSRWFDIPSQFIPHAEFLIIVLYDKAQIDKEGRITEGEHGFPDEEYKPLDADYGVVAILGQMYPHEEPINPTTMVRNHLGEKFGGSGFPINEETYKKSVDFWTNNAVIG